MLIIKQSCRQSLKFQSLKNFTQVAWTQKLDADINA